MTVYQDRDLQKLVDEIGANYISTVSDDNETENIDVPDSFDIDISKENATNDIQASQTASTQASPINDQSPSIGKQINIQTTEN